MVLLLVQYDATVWTSSTAMEFLQQQSFSNVTNALKSVQKIKLKCNMKKFFPNLYFWFDHIHFEHTFLDWYTYNIAVKLGF